MQRVCIKSADERLYREIVLLLPDGDTVVTDMNIK